MWQQGGYGVLDSGVHSGATTGAHSIREEELGEDPLLFDLDSQGYTGFTQDQVDGKCDIFGCKLHSSLGFLHRVTEVS